MEKFDLSRRISPKRLAEFAGYVKEQHQRHGFKISSRGWGYALEVLGHIDKSQFDKVEAAINRCRKAGLLPIDFVAEEESRQFSGIELPSYKRGDTIEDILRRNLEDALDGSYLFTPDWWDGEEFYIQMVVEKIDLKTLFEPVCAKYKIPIATSRGWSSMLMRASYAKRFQEAEQMGLKCVLLYCGDHDPDGLRISQFLRSNLAELDGVTWSDGTPGYDPTNLEIDRFGLNKALIDKHKLTWIDNLVTGSGSDLASSSHHNHKMEYVQKYIKQIGKRKCEANAIIPFPEIARKLVTDAIENYLGPGAPDRFEKKREAARVAYDKAIKKCGLDRDAINEALDNL